MHGMAFLRYLLSLTFSVQRRLPVSVGKARGVSFQIIGFRGQVQPLSA